MSVCLNLSYILSHSIFSQDNVWRDMLGRGHPRISWLKKLDFCLANYPRQRIRKTFSSLWQEICKFWQEICPHWWEWVNFGMTKLTLFTTWSKKQELFKDHFTAIKRQNMSNKNNYFFSKSLFKKKLWGECLFFLNFK